MVQNQILAEAAWRKFPNIDKQVYFVLNQWAALVRHWNLKINLISRRDIDFLESRHLSHCLAITNYLKLSKGSRILDVGTGGGFPGIVMAICYPQADFTLVDSIGKKVLVVTDIVQKLGLTNVQVRQIRAEKLDEKFDFITGRAVKNLPEYFSWIRGNLRTGTLSSVPNGIFYWKGGEFEEELDILGIRPRKIISLGNSLGGSYFKQKYILYFDAKDVAGACDPKRA